MGKRFIVYGLLGWCLEIFWTGLNSLLSGDIALHGFTYLWMFPIYGLAIILEPVHNYLREKPVLVRGGVYTIIIFTIEYSTGTLLALTTGKCPWNYGYGPLVINGIIRLDYAPFWFIAGIGFEQVHDFLLRMQKAIRV